MEDQSDLLTRKQAAELMKVGIRTIDRWMKNGVIKRYEPRSQVRGQRGTAWIRVSRSELLDLTRAKEGK